MAFLKLSLVIGYLVHLSNGSPFETPTQDLTSRIVGGVEAPENHSPHAMALTIGFNVRSLMCGASIISDCHVLTAAHCIEAFFDWNGQLSTSLRGSYGSNKWESTDNTVEFLGYVIHDKYDRYIYKNDIGVLCAKRNSESHRWVAIPLNFNWIEPGHKSYVTGWGLLWNWGPVPAKLQLIHLETISHERCARAVVEALPPGFWTPPVDKKVEICTLHRKGAGFGVCNGDSGSALVSRENNTQIGIVSWGFPCANGVPDMFVRLSAFKYFLLDVLKSCKCKKS